MTSLTSSQNKRRALYRNLMIAAFIALLLAAFASRVIDGPLHLLAGACVVIIGVLSLLQFNALDEMAKQAHYIAWYWGSLIALSVVAALGISLSLDALPFAAIEAATQRVFGDASPTAIFLFGLMAGPFLLVLGFFGWWSVYWLRRR